MKFNIIFTVGKILLDTLIVYFSFLLAFWVRFNIPIIPVTKGVPSIQIYMQALPVVLLIFLMTFKWSRFYKERVIFYKTDEFLNIIKAVVVAMIITVAATFIYRDYTYSRVVMGYALLFNIFFIYAAHRGLALIKGRMFFGKIGILVIGGKKVKETLLKNILKHKEFNVYNIGEIEFEKINEFFKKKAEGASVKKNGLNDRFLASKSLPNIKEVVLVETDIERKKILKLINLCEKNNIAFKMVPDMLELKMGEMSFDSYFGVPVLELKHPLFEPSNYYVKRLLDIALSMAVIIIMAPFLIIIMIAIKLDSSGSVIYSHLRRGFKGRDFAFYKFRSMIRDADEKLKEVVKNSERSGPVFKMKNDPRITRIGKFIRKYSIDEIPQLFNVLKGDMSLVGPRPQVLWEADHYDEEAKRRLNIPPGITGLWQISGRSDVSYEEMIKLDMYYLENWTPGFDIKILLRTIPVVLSKKGAC